MRFTITRQVALLFFIPLVGMMTAVGFLYFEFDHQRPSGHFINIAGRQRMVAEQLGAYAHMVHMGQDEDRASLRDLIVEFERALRAMEHGGVILNRTLPPLKPELEGEFAVLDALWAELQPQLLLVAALPIDAPKARNAYGAVQSLVPQLRDASDRIVVAFDAHNAEHWRTMVLFLGGCVGLCLLLGMVGIWTIRRYVVERNTQEKAIRASERQFRELLEFAPDAVVIGDEEGRIVRANRHVEEMFGHNRETLIGRPFDILMPERQRSLYATAHAQICTEPDIRPRGFGQEIYGLHRDGHEFRADMTLSAIHTDSGTLTYCAIRDITPLIQMQQALQESEEKFRLIAASAQDAIVMINTNGAITYWNDAAERIFGYRAEEMLNRDGHAMFAPARYYDDFKRGFAYFKEFGKGAVVGKTLELTAQRKDESEFPIELSVGAVQIQGEWHAIGVVRDITERKNIEKTRHEAERLRVLTQAAGGAAHEINQPLTVIIGQIDIMLMAMAVDDPAREDLIFIREAADRINLIVRKMQDIKRYAARRYVGNAHIVDFDAAADEDRPETTGLS